VLIHLMHISLSIIGLSHGMHIRYPSRRN